MIKNNDLLITLFIIIVLAILAIYCFTLYEVQEIKNYLEVGQGVKPSDEFRFLKDFTDRNVKVYGIVTTTIVTCTVFGTGLIFYFINEGKVSAIRSALSDHINHTNSVNETTITQNQKTLQEINLNTANSFAAIADVLGNMPENLDLEHSIYIRTYAIYHYLKSVENIPNKDDKISQWESVPIQLDNLIEDLKSIESISDLKTPEYVKTYLLNNCPEKFTNEIVQMINILHQKSASA